MLHGRLLVLKPICGSANDVALQMGFVLAMFLIGVYGGLYRRASVFFYGHLSGWEVRIFLRQCAKSRSHSNVHHIKLSDFPP